MVCGFVLVFLGGRRLRELRRPWGGWSRPIQAFTAPGSLSRFPRCCVRSCCLADCCARGSASMAAACGAAGGARHAAPCTHSKEKAKTSTEDGGLKDLLRHSSSEVCGIRRSIWKACTGAPNSTQMSKATQQSVPEDVERGTISFNNHIASHKSPLSSIASFDRG